jgi:hypothetical protein
VVVRLRHPLALDVLERRGEADAEADEEDVGLWVGERAEAVVFFSACVCITYIKVMDKVRVSCGVNYLSFERAHAPEESKIPNSNVSVPTCTLSA